MGAMKVWDGTTWQTVAPFSERASCYVGPDAPAGTTYAGDLWWDTDDPTIAYPGAELAYNQIAANVPISATTDAAAQTVVAAPATTFDGSPIVVEFFCPNAYSASVAGSYIMFTLWDGSTNLGWLCGQQDPVAALMSVPVRGARRLTPTVGSHTYSIRSWASTTGMVQAGPGGAGAYMPAFIRVTRV